MQIEVKLGREEEKMTNIGFVKAMAESKMFTIEDLREICSYLYVLSFMFGIENKEGNK